MPYHNTNTPRSTGGTGGNRSNVPPRPASPQGLAEENALIARLAALNELEAETLVKIAEKAGKSFSESRIKTTQIRRIHEHIIRQLTRARTMKGETAKEIRLLKYHLVYAAGRERTMKPFADFFNPILDKVHEMKDLERFRQLFDAVLAYHKFFESN
jgi:CRISPR-associated protein Csm2